MARSGIAAAELLLARGKSVTLLDDRDLAEEGSIKALIAGGAKGPLPLSDAGKIESILSDVEALIVSPGVAVDHPMLVAAQESGLPLISEIELGWEAATAGRIEGQDEALAGGRTVAVTGTNGKTTVTSLIAHMARTAGLDGVEVGNIGNAFCGVAQETGKEAGSEDAEKAGTERIYALEVSSFQLETVRRFRPDVAVILNVTPDHLDRHGTMENYTAMKARIAENQTGEDFLIVNQDDIRCIEIGEHSEAQVLRFSLDRPAEAGAWLDDDRLVLGSPGRKVRRIIDIEDLPLPGMHNIANYLAAACAGMALGIDRKVMAESFRTFEGVPHRLQHVGSRGGVEFYNDSKATNVDSMLKAIESFSSPILLIAGGRDKRGPFAAAARKVGPRLKKTYLIGEATETIGDAWRGHAETEACGTLDAALERAAGEAEEGEIVLLSPGCASFDQFKNFEERGEVFTELVQKLTQAPVAPAEALKR